MTKQEFLNGKSFRLNQGSRRGESSFRFVSEEGQSTRGYLMKEIRSEKKGDVVLDSYEISVTKITDNAFTASGFIVGKPVRVRYRFDQLVEVD